MVMFWVAILAVSILLYVLLDGFDLGIGILFGLTRDEGLSPVDHPNAGRSFGWSLPSLPAVTFTLRRR